MIRNWRWIVCSTLVPLLIASAATAQGTRDDYDRNRDRAGTSRSNSLWGIRGGIGFTEGPDSFLMNFDVEHMVRDEVAVGLSLQLGVEDDFVIVTPMLFTRYIFDLSRVDNDALRKLQPFLQGGVGITHMDIDVPRSRDRDGTDFALSLGAGFDYPVNESISLGSRMLVTVIPGEVLNQRVYFSWEILSVRYGW